MREIRDYLRLASIYGGNVDPCGNRRPREEVSCAYGGSWREVVAAGRG